MAKHAYENGKAHPGYCEFCAEVPPQVRYDTVDRVGTNADGSGRWVEGSFEICRDCYSRYSNQPPFLGQINRFERACVKLPVRRPPPLPSPQGGQ